MKTTTFDTEKAKAVGTAVCSEFGFSVSDIHAYKDTIAKKVVVFLLTKLYGYDKRVLAREYQMTYLYVPTVVQEMEYMCKTVVGFGLKTRNVEKLVCYEEVLD